MADTPTATHNSAAAQFEIPTDAGLALLKYTRRGGTMDLVHTDVPRQLEGQGYGRALAKAALDHARAEGIKVIPSCAFIQAFLKRNPKYSDLVAATTV